MWQWASTTLFNAWSEHSFYFHTAWKMVWWSLHVHLTLLIRYRNNGLIPNGLWVSLPSSTTRGSPLRKASVSLLHALISDIRTKRARMELEINTYTAQLWKLTCEEQVTRIMKWCSKTAEKTSLETRDQKYDRLKKHENGTLDPKRVVKNRTLLEDEEKVLARGLNLAVPPPPSGIS